MRIGLLLVLIGTIYLLKNTGLITPVDLELLWPVLIILIGISFLARRCRHCGNSGCHGDCRSGGHWSKWKYANVCDCECDTCKNCHRK